MDDQSRNEPENPSAYPPRDLPVYQPEIVSAYDPNYEPEIVPAEVVMEAAPGTPWEWQEVRPVRPRRRWRLPLLLFVATCLSTVYAGGWDEWGTGDLTTALWTGLRYAVPVMTILICHEMGHFIQAWRYGVYASFPFFIPMPFSPLGTFGAVIAMEPRMGHRRALFDIGITGPLAGLVPTLIFCVVGLHYSTAVAPAAKPDQLVIGAPLLFQFLMTHLVTPLSGSSTIDVDPMAFAGWVGLLVTSLNLMPIGQLDGGHVLYALLRRKANRVASLLLLLAIVVVALNLKVYGGWMVMLFLLILMGPAHPPTANDDEPLGWFRSILGWLTLAFIFIGFTPTPILYIPY
jgi:membrane-associated protease RseP (regulator of RpoE activity)